MTPLSILIAAATIAAAEIADKTMLATVVTAVTVRKTLTVLAVATVAFSVANAPVILGGWFVSNYLSSEYLSYISGTLFIVFGIIFIIKKEEIGEKRTLSLLPMFFLILVSELGDKTQLASLALALRFNPLIVLIGAGLGFFAVNAIASKLAISVLKVPSPKIRSIFGSVFIIAGILSIILTYAYTTP